ncbi:MAG: hypothetical protein M1834_007270 [Cirrosporium novae-zelandiae]|nr:MAG: hypothetical protein M1834_007270 [Cirrosporium novae-zelandiae]
MANLLPQNLFSVTDRSVAITGAASGIGKMLAKGFAVGGANLILIDINDILLSKTKSELDEIIASIGGKTNITTVCVDLSHTEGLQAVIDRINASITSLDVLIHCAAIRYMNKIEFKHGNNLEILQQATSSASWEEWDHAFHLNLFAPYFLTAGLVKVLGAAAKRGDGRGCVILFSSPASVHNHQFVPAYQLPKAAIDHLVRILAAEFADFYIRVNAISPGLVPSGMTDPTDPNSNFHLAGETPARRVGDEEDMVGTAVWLASRAGAFMDGKVVRVEGGRLLVLKGVISNHD